MAFPQLGYPQYLSGSPVPAESASPREGAAELGSSAALLGLYANPYTAQSYGAFLPYSSAELALFSHMGSQYELKDSPGIHHPSFASHAAFYPYGQYQYGDPARAKSATRETTSTLKAWLQEHKKNPYPTKGEKIMLAIITKMTLTQVSTWFANARRRLKKENKVTWGRSAEDRDGKIFDSDNEGEKNEDEEIDLESIDIDNIDDNNEDHDDVSDKQEADGETVARNGDKTQQPLTVPTHRALEKTKQESAVSSPSNQVTYQQPDSKPKIWSLAETATSPDHSRRHAVSPPQHPAFLPSHGIYTCQVGKLHNWPNVAFLRDASLSGVKSLLGMDRTQQQYGHHAQTGLQQQPGMKSAPSAPAPNCETLTSRHTDREKVSRTTQSPTLSKTTPPHMHDSTRKQQETRHHAPVLAAST